MDILCVVVVYKPDISLLIKNIHGFIADVKKVIVWQNSKLTNENIACLNSSFNAERIVIAGNGTNEGIPKALNYAIDHMEEYECDNLLTMDQDSRWVNFHTYVSFIENEPKDRIYGPEVIGNTDTNIGEQHNKYLMIRDAGYVITSGMLCHRNVLSEVGRFNEALFIDAVDEEYCYRARNKGIKSVQVQGAFLKQQFGESRIESFAGRKTIVSNYSAFRYYYIVRNHLYLIRTSLPTKEEKKSIFINYVRAPLIKCFLFEKHKAKKLSAIVRGVFSGLTMKMVKEK